MGLGVLLILGSSRFISFGEHSRITGSVHFLWKIKSETDYLMALNNVIVHVLKSGTTVFRRSLMQFFLKDVIVKIKEKTGRRRRK